LCISGTVYEHVVAKLPLNYSANGVWVGQGAPASMRVYRVHIETTAKPSIWRPAASHTRIGWPRARRMARTALRYLGRYTGLWAETSNYPTRCDTRFIRPGPGVDCAHR